MLSNEGKPCAYEKELDVRTGRKPLPSLKEHREIQVYFLSRSA